MSPNDLLFSLICVLAGLVTVIALMSMALGVARSRQELTIVDTVWGLGFVAVAVVSFVVALAGDGALGTQLLLVVLVGVWGGRLAWYLHGRNSGKGEDKRYAELAEADGRSFAEVALKRVFAPQGLAMWIVSAPVMVGMNNTRTLWWLAVLGGVVWGVGFFFESVGDAQLKRFKADPDNQGAIMDRGLWRYTRHPNYFGDATQWWGLWIIAAGSWAGLATVVGPIAMTFFLTKVTGVANNERHQSSKPGWDSYARRTSKFVPLPPRKG